MYPKTPIFRPQIAYPGLNLNELIEIEELHRSFPEKPIMVVNGELERIRSGCACGRGLL